MKKRLTMLAICLMLIASFSVCLTLNNNLFASEESTYTCEINGVTANFTYNLSEDNKVEKLKCTNKNDLTGNITIPGLIDGKEVISIGSNAFSGAANITGVILPETIETIEYSAFSNCTSLKNVNLGSINGMSFDAFSGCTALEEIKIPNTVVNSSTGAPFRGCTNLRTITLEEGLTKIPMYLCAGTAIEEMTIPNSVEIIAYEAFSNCTELKKITILDNVTSMGFTLSGGEVFNNHNEDLTIYCYRDTVAAKHAIDYNIKYVYLDKPVIDDNNDNNNNDNNNNDENNENVENKENVADNEEVIENSNNNKDTIINESSNPKTGDETFYILAILSFAIVGYVISSRVLKNKESK